MPQAEAHLTKTTIQNIRSELTRARRLGGLSQTVVAARMCTSQSHLSDLEAGHIDPELSTALRWAWALDYELVLQRRPPGDGPK